MLALLTSLSASVCGSTDPESNAAAAPSVQNAEVEASSSPFAPQPDPDEAHCITASDGTRLALSVYFPPGFDRAASRAPVAYIEIGSGEGSEARSTPIDLYRNAGFVVVVGDLRGFGASLGSQPGVLTDSLGRNQEDVVRWLVAAPWSNGKVVSVGWSAPGAMLTGHVLQARLPALWPRSARAPS